MVDDIADLAAVDDLLGEVVDRVLREIVAHPRDEPTLGGKSRELGRFGRRRGEGLLVGEAELWPGHRPDDDHGGGEGDGGGAPRVVRDPLGEAGEEPGEVAQGRDLSMPSPRTPGAGPWLPDPIRRGADPSRDRPREPRDAR